MKMHTILETARLILRPVRIMDAPQMQRLFPHWEIVKYMRSSNVPWPYPSDGAHRFLETIALPNLRVGSEYGWAIILKKNSDDALIGLIGLFPNSKTDNRGFWLAQEYHNNGLMKEATKVVTDFAFYELKMACLNLTNAEPNKASQRIKELSGARIVSVDDDISYVGGRFRRMNWLMTLEDWELHRQNM